MRDRIFLGGSVNKKVWWTVGILALIAVICTAFVYINYFGVAFADLLPSGNRQAKSRLEKPKTPPENTEEEHQELVKGLPKKYLKVVALDGVYKGTEKVNVTVTINGISQKNPNLIVATVTKVNGKDKFSKELREKISGIPILAVHSGPWERFLKRGATDEVILHVVPRPHKLYGFFFESNK